MNAESRDDYFFPHSLGKTLQVDGSFRVNMEPTSVQATSFTLAVSSIVKTQLRYDKLSKVMRITAEIQFLFNTTGP